MRFSAVFLSCLGGSERAGRRKVKAYRFLSCLGGSRSVVTAAAIIMIAVFGGFIYADDPYIRPIGFGLAIGVLFDAFLVRMLLVPALMHLLGPAAWYMPKWLDRILPNVDVEGTKLTEAHDERADEKTSRDAPVTTTSHSV